MIHISMIICITQWIKNHESLLFDVSYSSACLLSYLEMLLFTNKTLQRFENSILSNDINISAK